MLINLSSFVRPIEVAYSNNKCVDWNPQRECVVIDFNQLKVESSKILVTVPSKNSYVTCFYHSLACMFCVGGCRKNDCNMDFIFPELLYTNSPVRTILNLLISLQPTHIDQCNLNYNERERALKIRNLKNETKCRINKTPCLKWMFPSTYSAVSFRSGGCNDILEADQCGLKEAAER